MIKWYIDTDGFPIMERSGINRYFFKLKDSVIEGSSRDEVIKIGGDALDEIIFTEKKHGREFKELIKSITFVHGRLDDNVILNKNNPEYRANMYNMSDEWKQRYYYGNWKIKMAGNMLFDYDKIEGLFDYTCPQTVGTYITCDAASTGHDLMMIYVWKGWQVVACSIQTKSNPQGIYEEIEYLRRTYYVMKNKVVVDADGVGNDTIKLSNKSYLGFHGGNKCKYDDSINKREFYTNYKTQCYYRIAKRVNEMTIGITLVHGSIRVDGRISNNILLYGETYHVTDVIKKHLRSIRKADNSEGKHGINSKDEQKVIVGNLFGQADGISPDGADTLMMREHFEFDKPIM